MNQTSEKEEKKKGGVPLPGGASSGAGAAPTFSLEQLENLQFTLSQAGQSAAVAAGGGAASAGAALASKVGMLIVLTMLGAGAMNMVNLHRPQKSLPIPASRPEQKMKYTGDLSQVPHPDEVKPALQDVVLGDLGKAPDTKVADAASAGAAAADKSADEAKAAASAQSNATPAMAAGDLTAKAAKMPQAKPGFDKKFGALSGDLGGGAASGSGASFGAKAPAVAALANEAKGFGASKAGKTQGIGAKTGAPRAGNAFGQLVNINGLSRQGARVGGESGSVLAGQGFNGIGGGGSAISGGGAGITGAGVTMMGGDKNTNGNPIGQNGGAGNGTQAPPTAGHTNATPWQTWVDIARLALAVACLCMVIASILGLMAKASTLTVTQSMAYRTWAMYLAYVACACAAVATLAGIAILAMGQTKQGLIFTLTGGFTAAMAYIYAEGVKPPDNPQSLIAAANPTPTSMDAGMTHLGTVQGWSAGATEAQSSAITSLTTGPSTLTQYGAYGASAASGGGAIFGH